MYTPLKIILIAGIFGYVSQIKLYFAQLRHYEANIDLHCPVYALIALIAKIYVWREIFLFSFFFVKQPSIPVVSVINNVSPLAIIYIN